MRRRARVDTNQAALTKLPNPKRSKFGAIRTERDGITFASKAESERYVYLTLLLKAKEISDLQLQPRFTLQEKFICNGRAQMAIEYFADFKYVEHGKVIIEDVKGKPTPVALMKFKMFRLKYPQYELRLVKKSGKGWKVIG